jgi:2-succinyl-5-enolpyruvyl-6-hydroxy-3-cyclohexene-1-carboxylate synthase
MNFYNTGERNIQIVLSLLKAHGIKRVVASPGSTDVAIVSSMQHDEFFEMYSSIDERSACYMACGMAAENGEPIVIVCTGATSSRNYMPGLTEAYYRHLPILAITCSRSNANVGHYVNQVTDRSNPPSDTVNTSVYVQAISKAEDEWDCMIKVNKAILGLTYNGGGPCHINLETTYSKDFSVKEIKPARVIKRYGLKDELPDLLNKRIGIFVGNFNTWSSEVENTVDTFCEMYDAVVFYDHSSNYKGKYGVLFPLISGQCDGNNNEFDIDIMIHIGYVSACVCKGREMWRVNADGEIRDPFRRTTCVFQMSEQEFFNYYVKNTECTNKIPVMYKNLQLNYYTLVNLIPELPFSNIWIAQQLSKRIPENSKIHLGICNSLRSWNFFTVSNTVNTYSNTGGFGIDGGISSLVGASMIHPEKLYYGIFGDLLFYYDMNCLGNRHILPNLRILVINNGLGQEFKNYSSYGAVFGDETDSFIAAKGHFGNRNRPVIEYYAKSLGFEYMSARNKEEFEKESERFVSSETTDKPMLFEVFTNTEDESNALELITTLTPKAQMAKKTKEVLNRPELAQLRKIAKKIIHKT